MNISIAIKRYNPAKDTASYKERYELPVDNKVFTTILDILQIIKEKVDGTLSFRCSCRSGICGSCAVRVNGHEVLACTTDLMDVIRRHGTVIIEPLKNLGVVKDLVVDLGPMWSRLHKLDPWVISDGVSDVRWDKKTEFYLNMANKCMLCGACYSDCEAFKVDEYFLGPAVFNKGYRLVIDPRDKEEKERLKKLAQFGLWHCSHCYLCSSICPKGINPKDSISYLRYIAYRKGIKYGKGVRYIDSFYKGVKGRGKISELLLALRVKGIDIIKELSFLSRILIHGKVSCPRRPLRGIDEIRKIYDIIDKERRDKP